MVGLVTSLELLESLEVKLLKGLVEAANVVTSVDVLER